MKKTVCLIIMDGYGLAAPSDSNAVSLAKKPNLDEIFSKYDTHQLQASGEAVGLPEGQMGNSEVGHMNLGAGRIVYQSLSRINNSIKSGDFKNNEAINHAIDNAIKNNKKFHVLGLASDGGVHAAIPHICAIANLAHEKGIKDVYFHAFLDGRDVAPKSAAKYIKEIIDGSNVHVATVQGRYYGMDRDKNYDRIQKGYDAMTQGIGEYYSDPFEGIKASYAKDVTDEFMVPFISDKNGMIEDGDSVVFANFRPDRAIQIATALSNPNGLVYNPLKPYKLDTTKGPKKTFFVSMMKYSDTVLGELAFGVQKLTNLMGDIVANNNMTQLRIAETEKYAHVTFFYDGGEDRTIKGADRILVNSPKVATYDLKPEMSAFEVRDKVVAAIKEEKYDMIILNFANCDMVGHTGVIPAAVKAVEAVDQCVGDVVRALDQVGGVAVITADHGNAEKLRDADGKPFTAHTTNPVPVVITDKNIKIRDGILSDLAPTMLELLGIEKPADMTSESIIIKK